MAELSHTDGLSHPWAQDLDGVWHFRPDDDKWVTQADIQAHGRCGAAFASCHVSGFWPGHLPDHDPICETCEALWRDQDIPLLARSVLDGLGPLYVEALGSKGPPEVQETIAWLKRQADEGAPDAPA